MWEKESDEGQAEFGTGTSEGETAVRRAKGGDGVVTTNSGIEVELKVKHRERAKIIGSCRNKRITIDMKVGMLDLIEVLPVLYG